MCGIVSYTGKRPARKALIDGLKRVEYRGYDSAGIATHEGNGFKVIRRAGRIDNLSEAVDADTPEGTIGIAHTRWATHGGVTEANAHPHVSSDGKFALVHNGIIENHEQIKKLLEPKGYTFSSETDSEALVNLIAYYYSQEPDSEDADNNRFVESVRKSLLHIEGTYGIVAICADYPEDLVGARKSSPLVLGIGKDEKILASDVSAFVKRTQDVVYLRDGEIIHVTRDDFSITTIKQKPVSAVIEKIDWNPEDAELGDFQHFMEKEIFEQPAALENAMRGHFAEDGSTALFGGLNMTPQELRQIDRIIFCACGTAWHACQVAEYLIERYARIPVEVEYASEFRYRNAPLEKNTLVFVISQSGETLDTLAALRESQRKGYKTLGITNVVGSTIARETDGGIYQHAGPEIGVASTKAFTSQLMVVSMLALYLGRMRDMSPEDGVQFVNALKEAPEMVRKILADSHYIRDMARKYKDYEDFLFLGRQALFPIALEGALKLKEISYIHAEGYPAAELKHGPIALISPECPSVFLANHEVIFNKTLANMQEVKARNGKVIAVASAGRVFPDGLVDDLITVPQSHPALQPLLATIPLQLLSYYIAVERGCDVDKPRNLAKSVTVE